MKLTKIFSYLIAVFLISLCCLILVVYAFDVAQEAGDSQPQKITNALIEAYDSVGSDDTVVVFTWMKDVDFTEQSKEAALEAIGMSEKEWEAYIEGDTDNEIIQKYIVEKRNASSALYSAYNAELSDKVFKEGEIVYTSRYSPVVIAELNYQRALEISQSADIDYLDYISDTMDEEIPVETHNSNISRESINLEQMKEIIQADDVHDPSVFGYGYTGEGVIIGVLENSIPTLSDFSDYDIRGTFGNVNSYYEGHANMVLEILTTVAPDAAYYLASASDVVNGLIKIENLLSSGVNIINSSYHFGSGNYCEYSLITKWLDHIAYSHDVHYVAAAGNEGGFGVDLGAEFEYEYRFRIGKGVPASSMAFNIITVGNLNVNGTVGLSDDFIALSSSYYNNDIYLNNKPDLVAPGEYIETSYDTTTGTSLSAPQVSGAIALLCEQNNSLKFKQDVVKAILTAAVSFESPHAYVSNALGYFPYGAGVLDCVGACWVSNHGRYIQSSIASNTESHSYSFYVSETDTRIRVSLAFLVKCTPNSSLSHDGEDAVSWSYPSDLNLEVYAPGSSTPIAVSQTMNNNIEIVDFIPPTTGMYTIKVVNEVMNYSPTYYAVAWI